MKTIVLALAASLSACAASGAHPARADAALTRAEAGFAAARALATLFAPWLTPGQALRIDGLARTVEAALAAARHASDLAERRAALRRAESATATYRHAVGG